jgi:hypothetical protein
MAYYTGVATNYADLLNALTSNCQSNGWTWADGILSKGALYVSAVEATATTGFLAGIRIQGGTGKSGSSLTGAAWIRPKMAAPYTAITVAWPVEYHLHIFTAPDEVYMIVKYNVDRYMWLSFGQSNVPGLTGTGLWTSAVSANRHVSSSYGSGGTYFNNNHYSTYIGDASQANHVTSAGFFMVGQHSPQVAISQSAQQDSYSNTLHTGFDTVAGGWTYYPYWDYDTGFNDFGATAGQLATRSLSLWSQEATMIPFSVYENRGSSKVALVMQPKNSRFLNITNYEPGQIITLGADKWKVYPFAKKNASGMTSEGQYYAADSGRHGWAIRYDGP